MSGAVRPDGIGKVNDRNPIINANEKSDMPIVPKKLPNKEEQSSKKVMEGRGIAGRNTNKTTAPQTQSCAGSNKNCASIGLEGVRKIARAKTPYVSRHSCTTRALFIFFIKKPGTFGALQRNTCKLGKK